MTRSFTLGRRDFLALSSGALAAAVTAGARAQTRLLKPPRLRPGHTVGLVNPAGATYNPVDVDIVKESVEALGLRVKIGAHVLDRHGYFAGRDEHRAADLNAMFRDPDVHAVLCVRGGWGSARLLPLVDFEAVAARPKILVGYSDITALLLAVHAKTGLVTFHGPNALGRWDEYSVDYLRRLLLHGEVLTFENLRKTSDRNVLTQTEHRVQTITPGQARGRLLGGNLTVLTTIIGSDYLPAWDGAIFFCEDVDEGFYRLDRMFTQMKLAGILSRIRGFIFGTCAECGPGQGFGGLTLEEILADHIKPLGVPAWTGAMIGHQTPQWTLPVGLEVEIDATRGSITMHEPAVT